MPNPNRPHTDLTRYATYHVRVTGYPSGRKRTFLIPANSQGEAEQRARSRYGAAPSGYHFDTKKVSDKWREYE